MAIVRHRGKSSRIAYCIAVRRCTRPGTIQNLHEGASSISTTSVLRIVNVDVERRFGHRERPRLSTHVAAQSVTSISFSNTMSSSASCRSPQHAGRFINPPSEYGCLVCCDLVVLIRMPAWPHLNRPLITLIHHGSRRVDINSASARRPIRRQRSYPPH